MPNNQQPNKTVAGTSIQKIKQQNAASVSSGQFGAEFASETNAQEVRQQNAQSVAKKNQNANFGQQQS